MLRPHNDDYKQIRVLGKGAYGEVWLVSNKENPDEQVLFFHNIFSLNFFSLP